MNRSADSPPEAVGRPPPPAPMTSSTYDKVRQSVTEQSKSKKHGPITGSDLGRNSLIRGCDWSMLFALLLLCNTLTHFVILPMFARRRCDVH